MNVIPKVSLVGAGSGDPELLTLKALHALENADIILVDRLVSPEIINRFVAKKTTVIYVGKQCSKGIQTPQSEINELLKYHACAGKKVVRLKGGDPSLFSNILTELQFLKTHQIPYEIIPGVSAAFSAAAYAAIPLTARDYARGLRLLTLFDIKSITTLQWQDWAKTTDTLVFYMSGKRILEVKTQLEQAQISTQKKMAIIEQASTPVQKTNIQEFYKDCFFQFNFVPTLLIIGEVVTLHETYKWFIENNMTNSYFDK